LLLMGGPYTEGFASSRLGSRLKTVGLVDDISTFYAACDVLAVPSRFEPLGLVAFEAAARGVPVIATEEVGALPHLLECGAGLSWDSSSSLAPLVRQIVENRERFIAGALRVCRELSLDRYQKRLLEIYNDVLQSHSSTEAEPVRMPLSTSYHGF